MARTNRFTLAVLLVVVVGSLSACSLTGAEKPSPTGTAPDVAVYPITITDDASRTVTLDKRPERIVSLAPANTEILFALGLGDNIVGVTTFDDYPADVELIERVGDFAGPNLEAVAAQDPDLVLATTGIQADVIAKLEELGATVVAIDPQSVEGVYEDIEELGRLTQRTDEARAVVLEMRAEIVEVQETLGDAKPVSAFVEIAQNPLFTVGQETLMNQLIELAGGKNIVREPGYVAYSVEQVVESDPEVYLATKGSMSDPQAIEKRAGFKGLSAVKNGRVVILDDNLVSRPGPRLVEGLRQIAKGLHPDAFEGR